jgi:hypothetical protein
MRQKKMMIDDDDVGTKKQTSYLASQHLFMLLLHQVTLCNTVLQY